MRFLSTKPTRHYEYHQFYPGQQNLLENYVQLSDFLREIGSPTIPLFTFLPNFLKIIQVFYFSTRRNSKDVLSSVAGQSCGLDFLSTTN
ncbi:MAG: hypothetical protein CSA26_00380 [Desulfobacterales bacterium]|nr:MAG: hypothetical protein CSA26_00380 [Desulfobacterales bacterium]